jgi:hypothetical protein
MELQLKEAIAQETEGSLGDEGQFAIIPFRREQCS